MERRCWLALVLAGVLAGVASPSLVLAAPVPVDADASLVHAGGDVAALEDTAGRARLEEVQRRDAEFVAVDGPAPNFGPTRSAIWLRYELESGGNAPQLLYLQVGNPEIADAALFVTVGGRLLTTYTGHDNRITLHNEFHTPGHVNVETRQAGAQSIGHAYNCDGDGLHLTQAGDPAAMLQSPEIRPEMRDAMARAFARFSVDMDFVRAGDAPAPRAVNAVNGGVFCLQKHPSRQCCIKVSSQFSCAGPLPAPLTAGQEHTAAESAQCTALRHHLDFTLSAHVRQHFGAISDVLL